jgi:hypothetical protein
MKKLSIYQLQLIQGGFTVRLPVQSLQSGWHHLAKWFKSFKPVDSAWRQGQGRAYVLRQAWSRT